MIQEKNTTQLNWTMIQSFEAIQPDFVPEPRLAKSLGRPKCQSEGKQLS